MTDGLETAANRDGLRNVAFVWHLAKNWEPKWGGSFYWCSSLANLPASFNTLVLFNVNPRSVHLVTEVSPYAAGKRLAINGWWKASSPESTGKDRKDLPAITSDPPSAPVSTCVSIVSSPPLAAGAYPTATL